LPSGDILCADKRVGRGRGLVYIYIYIYI